MFKVYIHVDKCSRCPRTETCRWYGKETDSPYCASCYRKEYVANNREKALAAQRKANASETAKRSRMEYEKTPRGKVVRRNIDRYHSPIRKRRLLNASFNEKYKSEIQQIYNECPNGYHVDHVIPIKGYDYIDGNRQHVVCGLHVPWNLQYLTKEQNLKKNCNLYAVVSEEA